MPFRGFMLVITSFRLFLLSVIPVGICIAFVFWLIWWFMKNPFLVLPYAMKYVPGLQSFVDNLKIGEFSIFDAILQGLFWVFLILFASYFSYLLLSIIGAPFYSLMSSMILSRKNVQPPPMGFVRWFFTTLKMFTISLLKILFFVSVGGFLFFFSFLPAGMILVPICMCLMISYDCFDFSFETMTYSIRERWSFFYQNLSAFAGLAFIILLVGTIPGFFSLTLPLFIAGGAELFGDLHLASRKKSSILDPETSPRA